MNQMGAGKVEELEEKLEVELSKIQSIMLGQFEGIDGRCVCLEFFFQKFVEETLMYFLL